MTGGGIDAALTRIEDALTRLEAAARTPRSSDDGLAERHEALRHRVSDAIARLDTLIGSADEDAA